ncbi:DNA-binding protein [Clostridium tetani]|uniref:helix-turn-helix transcriptional regulator n=1 Tax=Clostridium tetani TaxID=1513 RepID=UPI00057333A2|nr:helix-turn-helix transcriptional regulator [Clostridium tetani]KHO39185.1 DNA-binding protein [Clostridium tetani]
MFCERLKDYRESIGFIKRELAEKLSVSESYYNMIENGKREPSKNFIEKLVVFSEKPEEYWLYGISEENYAKERDSFKSTKKAVKQLLELNLINNVEDLFKGQYEPGTLEELLITALKADISYLLENNEK